jgi:hypothetical protein
MRYLGHTSVSLIINALIGLAIISKAVYSLFTGEGYYGSWSLGSTRSGYRYDRNTDPLSFWLFTIVSLATGIFLVLISFSRWDSRWDKPGSFPSYAQAGNSYATRVISPGIAGPNPEPPPLPQYKVRGHVNDFAGILNSEMRSELNGIGDELERKRKTQIVFVTVTWLDNVPLDDLASQLTKSWGVGGKNNDREILVLISLQESRSLIRASPDLSWDLSPAEADRLGQEMVPMMEKGNYGDALIYTAKRIQQELQNE